MDYLSTCPVCGEVQPRDSDMSCRFSTAVCTCCLSKYGTVDKYGDPIEFRVDSDLELEEALGHVGVERFYSLTCGKVHGMEHECYVNGVPCYAFESATGDIVILSTTMIVKPRNKVAIQQKILKMTA